MPPLSSPLAFRACSDLPSNQQRSAMSCQTESPGAPITREPPPVQNKQTPSSRPHSPDAAANSRVQMPWYDPVLALAGVGLVLRDPDAQPVPATSNPPRDRQDRRRSAHL